jgi:exodeoxyribonuclease-3
VRIITWNVNSIRARQPRLEALLRRWEPDVVCLQETKVADAEFPAERFASLGYRSASFGRRSNNGVAVLTREEPSAVARGFPGDPAPEQPRVLAVSIGALRVVSVYAVNGTAVGHPAYALKLAWFDALIAWVRSAHDPLDLLLLVGDFNVAPADEDVHDPERWRDRNLASEPERDRIRELLAWGMIDLGRAHAGGPGPFTWWDYRAGAFHRRWGLRLDLALGTKPVAERCSDVRVDRDERKPSTGEGKPSDHAPVVVDLI